MPGSIGSVSECSICRESLRFYNNLDKYFHFLRHYNEKRLIAGNPADDQSPREKQQNVELVAQLKILVNYHKGMSQNDPTFQVLSIRIYADQLLVTPLQVPPGSTDWLDDKDLARLQEKVSAMDKGNEDLVLTWVTSNVLTVS